MLRMRSFMSVVDFDDVIFEIFFDDVIFDFFFLEILMTSLFEIFFWKF